MKYNLETFQLKSKCEIIALTTQDPYEKNVNDGTRDDPVQMKYSSVNAIFNIKKDKQPKYPQMLLNYLTCYRLHAVGMFHKEQ